MATAGMLDQTKYGKADGAPCAQDDRNTSYQENEGREQHAERYGVPPPVSVGVGD